MSCTRSLFLLALSAVLSAGPGLATELHDAVREGNLERVKSLLEAEPGMVNASNEGGSTPLHVAALGGHAKMVGLLLDKGADIGARAQQLGFSALHYAVYAGRTEVVRTLLDSGADVNGRDMTGFAALDLAIVFGKTEIASFLISGGADVDAFDGPGRTPLTHAADRGHREIVRQLIATGADINAPNRNGELPLFTAVFRGHTGVVTLLLGSGARTDVTQPRDGHTVLGVACLAGHLETVSVLVEAGLPVDAADRHGRVPLQYASRYGHGKIADYLLAHGARKRENLDENFGRSRHLARRLAPGEAVAWYLSNRGWAVKTHGHLLVFDAETFGVTLPDEPCLANGFLNADEIGDQRVFALYTAYHGDMGELSCIHELEGRLAEVTYIHHREDRFRGARNAVYLMPGREETLGNLRVHTLDTFDGNVSQAYLGRIDGLTFFYAGSRPEDDERYKQEITTLAAQFGRVDLAFLPISETEGEMDLLLHHLERLRPRAVFLLDPERREHLFPGIARAIAENGFDTPVYSPTNPGDHFVVQSRRRTSLLATPSEVY